MHRRKVVAFVQLEKLDENNTALMVSWKTLTNVAIIAQAMKKEIRGQQPERKAAAKLNVMCISKYKSPVDEYQTPLLRMLEYGTVVTFGFVATDRERDNDMRVIGGVFNPDTVIRVDNTPTKFECTETTAAFLTQMWEPNPWFPAKTDQSNEADTAAHNEDEEYIEVAAAEHDEAHIQNEEAGLDDLTAIINGTGEDQGDDTFGDDDDDDDELPGLHGADSE